MCDLRCSLELCAQYITFSTLIVLQRLTNRNRSDFSFFFFSYKSENINDTNFFRWNFSNFHVDLVDSYLDLQNLDFHEYVIPISIYSSTSITAQYNFQQKQATFLEQRPHYT